MDGIFNSPFMVKLQEFGQKLGSNKFLSALQGAMMSCMAPIMVGAIFSIICAVLESSRMEMLYITYYMLHITLQWIYCHCGSY